MSKVFKPVSVAFLSIILALSLSGCKDKDAQTAINNGGLNEGTEAIASDSGKVKLVLKPGVKYLQLYFGNKDSRDAQGGEVAKLLKEKGVIVEKAGVRLSASGGYYKIDIRVPKNITVNIGTEGLDGIVVESALGMVANWDPMQGNEVRYE